MLDRRDASLLSALATNARVSQVDLAQRVGLSPTACARRQRQLEEQGIITGYHAQLDLARLGLHLTVVIRITLDNQREDTLEAFEKAVVKCPSVLACLLMSGTDDYLVTVLARGMEDFEHLHKTELSRLPGVSRMQSSFAIREVINRRVPPVALEDPPPRRGGHRPRGVA